MVTTFDGQEIEGVDNAITRGDTYGMRPENSFSGILSFLRTQYSKELEHADIAITGIPYDLAVSNRPGTRFGPRAVREASTDLAWGPQFPWTHDPLKRVSVIDYGDCDIDIGNPHLIPKQIEQHIDGILGAGVSSIAIGGDHFMSLPIMRSYAKKYGPLAMVQFDAHSDTWSEETKRIDHGTMFFHAIKEGIIDPKRSIQIGIRTFNSDQLGIRWLDANWVHENGIKSSIAEIIKATGDGPAYLTFDIDCLDPAFAPGTGTPVCGGLSTYQARSILNGLNQVNFKGMDLVEVSPHYDSAGITALAAATLILDYLQMLTVNMPDSGGT